MHMLGREESSYTQWVGLTQPDQARVGSTLTLNSQATMYECNTVPYRKQTNVRSHSADKVPTKSLSRSRYERQMAEVAALARLLQAGGPK